MNVAVYVVCAAVVGALSALYMIEMTPQSEDELIELGSTQVLLIAQCSTVFKYVSHLSNYAQWFPGITNITEIQFGPMETGKQFEEIATYPILGDITRLIYVAEYSPPERVRFIYDDWNMIEVAITASQKTEDRCRIGFHVGTKHTSYLYHIFVGFPYRVVYSLRGRHAMFTIRSMFNNAGMATGQGDSIAM